MYKFIGVFVICFLLASAQERITWQKLGNVGKYDVINDYINRLFYFILKEDDSLYQSIYYYDEDIIIKQKLNIENPESFKFSYNGLVYPDETFYHAALLTTLKNNSLSIYLNDNFGYHRNSSSYHWDLIKTIEIQNTLYDVGYGINNSWIICYDKECQITYDGLEWEIIQMSYSNCSDIKIVSSHTNNWAVYCYDGIVYQSAIHYNNTFEIGFGVGADEPNMKIATLPDGKTLFLIGNNTYYSSNLKNEFIFARDYTNDLAGYPVGLTDVIASARMSKFHLVLANQISTTANGANVEAPTVTPIQSINNTKIISTYLTNHFGMTYPISHENDELYIARMTILTLGSEWQYLPRKDNIEIEYPFDDELILSGDIKLVSNNTLLMTTNLTINGNLTLNTNLILNQTLIEVNGTLHLGGNLTIYLPDIQENFTIFTFTNSTGQFENVEFKNQKCGEYLEYQPSSISVLFDSTKRCGPDEIKEDFVLSNNFLYIIIASFAALVILILLISFFIFRKKLFPHRYAPSELQE